MPAAPPTVRPSKAATDFRVPVDGHQTEVNPTPEGAYDHAASVEPRSAFSRSWVRFVLLSAPALWLAWLMFSHGVDTPWGDQWDTSATFLEKSRFHVLHLSDFFAFHNEHRHFFPSLLSFGLANLTGWNIHYELLTIWVLLCVCALNFARLATTAGIVSNDARLWLLLAANVLVFTPAQWENLLWGFQIGFILPLAAMTACPWLAMSLRWPFNFIATLLTCLLSTFSVASGFCAWLVSAPVLLFSARQAQEPRRAKTVWTIWLATALISIFVYFHGYQRPVAHPSPLEAFKHPLLALQFSLDYLGRAFSSGTAFTPSTLAAAVGAVLLALLVACVAYIARERNDRRLVADAMPWMSLTLVALVNAALTTLGRVGFGLSAALQSRYVSFAVTLPIGLLFLITIVFRHWTKRNAIGAARMSRGLVSLGTALLLLFLCNTVYVLGYWDSVQHEFLLGKAILLVSNVLDEPEAIRRHMHWSGSAIRPRTAFLAANGLIHPTPLRSADVRTIAYETSEQMGELTQLQTTADGAIEVQGWAFLPGRHRVADSVLLTYEDAAGRQILFSRVDVGEPRPQLSQERHDRKYYYSGWKGTWKRSEVPPDAHRINAWAFDAQDCRAFAIGAGTI